MKYNTLRVRLDDAYWKMLNELCQHLDRDTPDMVRKLIRDAHAKMQSERLENPPTLSHHE